MNPRTHYVIRVGRRILFDNDHKLGKEELREIRDKLAKASKRKTLYEKRREAEDNDTRAHIDRKIDAAVRQGKLPYISRRD